MGPIGEFRGSVQSSHDHATIKIKGYEEVPIKVKIYAKEKFSAAEFLKKIIKFFRRKREFVPLKVNDQVILVKVADLAKNLGLQESEILKPEKFEQKVHNLLQARKFAQLTREQLSNEHVITKAGSDASPLDTDAIDKIASIVFKAHLTLQQKPSKPLNAVHQVISITDNLRILAEDSSEGLKITTIFGKKVGKGTFGTAVQSIKLVGSGMGREIVKLPTQDADAKRQLENEAKIIQDINPQGLAYGIQKPLFLGDSFHMGVQYDGSLKDAINNPGDFGLSEESLPLVAFQLMEGLTTIHEKGISHADIKPKNIFYDKPRQVEGVRVYIGDFGDAAYHDAEYREERARTVSHFVKRDERLSKLAKKREENKLYAEIEEKSDVFAMCSSIAEVVTKKMPYSGHPGEDESFSIEPNLVKQLENGGLNQKCAELIVAGLDPKFEKRPTARQLRDALEEAIGVPSYDSLPELTDGDVEKQLINEPIGTYFLRKGPAGLVKVTVKFASADFKQLSFETQEPFIIREKLNALRGELNISKENFNIIASQKVAPSPKPPTETHTQPLKLSKREVQLLLEKQPIGTSLVYESGQGIRRALLKERDKVELDAAAGENPLKITLEDLERLSPSKISKVKAMVALKKMPPGTYILREVVTGELEVSVHLGDKKIQHAKFPMPLLSQLGDFIDGKREKLGLVKEYIPDES